MKFMQFVLDSDGPDKIAETEKIVRDNLHASLAADDNPSNDDHPISVSYKAGVDSLGRSGTYVIGEVEAEPAPYPEVPREDWEIPGAEKDKVVDYPAIGAGTDYDSSDDPDYLEHMLGKVVG